MGSKELDYQTCLAIMSKIGYAKPTDLQELAFKSAHYGAGAREFIIGTTSSGKTLIPIVAYLNDLFDSKKAKKMIYVLPYRALANQKEEDIKSVLGKFDNHLNIAISTSEYCISDDDIFNGRCDIAIIIYEKAYSFSVKNKNFFNFYDYIIFDEPGIVSHCERGLKADFLMQEACRCKNNIYVLASPYYNWELYIQKYGFNEIKSQQRPIDIKQEYLYYDIKKDEYYLDCISEKLIDICIEHRNQGHKILIFDNSRRGVRYIVKRLYEVFKEKGILRNANASVSDCLNYLTDRLDSTHEDLYGIFTDREDYLAFSNGIFYHNGAMPEEFRALIESEFLADKGILDIVVATETLAYGINSNVDVVIVTNLYKPGTGFLLPNEYMNYIGRAGRLGRSKYGYTYTFVRNNDKSKLNSLRSKIDNPKNIESSFAKLPDLPEGCFYCLNYLSNIEGMTCDNVLQRFLGYPGAQYKDINIDLVKSMLAQLVTYGLAKKEYDAFFDEELFKLTDKGLSFAGFILEFSVFNDLVSEKDRWLRDGVNNKLYTIIYRLCSYEGMVDHGNYLDKESKIEITHKYCKHFKKKCEELLNKKEMDNLLYRNINKTISKYAKNNPSSASWENIDKDWRKIRQLMKAEALYMWCWSRSIREIESVCYIAYGDLKRLGEKGKYYIDAVNSLVKLEDNGEISAFLVKLSASLFYGIRLDIISHYDILTIEPIAGRQLRTIGQILNIKDPNNSKLYHKLVEHVETHFPEEMKKLLQEREHYEQKN